MASRYIDLTLPDPTEIDLTDTNDTNDDIIYLYTFVDEEENKKKEKQELEWEMYGPNMIENVTSVSDKSVIQSIQNYGVSLSKENNSKSKKAKKAIGTNQLNSTANVSFSMPAVEVNTNSNFVLKTIPHVQVVASPELIQKYESSLNQLKFRFVDLTNSNAGYSFLQEFKNDSGFVPNPNRMKRLRDEIKDFQANISENLYLLVDENHFELMRILIIGAKETPYENGCFLFDIYCTSKYPLEPPKVKFLTTYGGSFRFNPNLYSCGKVCLSLLGTWSGPSWTIISNIKQVLLALQAQILNETPFFNEPGWESDKTVFNPENYERVVRAGTLSYAILNHIKNPPIYFDVLVHMHCWIQKERIQLVADRWLEMSKIQIPFNLRFTHQTPILKSLSLIVIELQESLNKLKEPLML